MVEVGGIGVRVSVTGSVLESAPALGKAIFLHTFLIVREDALTLYGFTTLEEREVFELLLQVNGVGPRLALAALSHLSPDSLRSAVGNNQPEALERVPGIGRKTAERIIFHLKDRLVAPLEFGVAPSDLDTEVLGVLTALGYSVVEAQAAIQSIPKDSAEDVEERVRLALQYFATP